MEAGTLRSYRRAAAALALSLALTLPGAALPQSEAYLYGSDKTSIPAPAPYQVRAVYDGLELGVGRLREPQDLHVDGTGAIYLADTGNNRIVRIRADFQSADVLTAILIDGREEPLSQPKGVFKAADGLLYICDTGNARIVAVNEKREAVRIMTNEGVTAINTHIQYTPEKVAVDTDGNVFVVDPSIYQGIVQYDAQDRFLGFFAPNEVKVTADVLFLQMWKKWFSTEQVESMEKSLPSPYSNLYIDRDNFLYTSSAGAGAGKALKHLNMLGVNILQPAEKKFGHGVFGDLEVSYDNGEEVASAFVDVCVTESGLLCGADATRGRLFLYDADCNLVAIWGGSGQRRGTFKALAAVERQGDSFLALDSEKASLTVFEPTAYMRRGSIQSIGYGGMTKSPGLLCRAMISGVRGCITRLTGWRLTTRQAFWLCRAAAGIYAMTAYGMCIRPFAQATPILPLLAMRIPSVPSFPGQVQPFMMKTRTEVLNMVMKAGIWMTLFSWILPNPIPESSL